MDEVRRKGEGAAVTATAGREPTVPAGRLTGKVALVTGAARGQGASHLQRLAQEGASVVGADVLDDAGEQTAQRLLADGLPAVYRHLDVADPAGWEDLVAWTENRFGHLDVLVNNAGTIHVAPIEHEALAEWQRLLDVNLTGAFLGIRAVIGSMRRARGGSIINIASIFGPAGAGGYSAYAASKSGLLGLTRTAALELAPDDIRVNAICPGGVATPMNESEKDGGVIPQTPMHRRAHVSEISAVVAFLASSDASFVTGASLVADGGFLAQ
jgi:3alpha(or 20beta)-hydroxysteroid dehydrogenase